MLDITALERALAPIAQVGKDEITFEVEGHTLTLRPLLPAEEVQVQRYAQEALTGHADKEGVDRYAALDYFHRYRVELIALTLVEVDGQDFRNEEYVATGEMTQAGKPVRVPRHVAIRDLISRTWSRTLLFGAFDKYSELMGIIEEKAAKAIKFSPSDLEAEIQRVEKRLSDLKAERDRRAKGDPNLTADQVKRIAGMDKPTPPPAKVPKAPSTESAPSALPPQAPPTPSREFTEEARPRTSEDEWATFEEMPKASDLRDVPPPPAPAATPPATRPTPPPPPPPPAGGAAQDPLADIPDSFVDVDDEKALAAEQARIMNARRKFQAEQQAAGGRPPAPPPRTPPHRRGVLPEESPLGLTGGEIREATPEELAARGIPPHLAGSGLSEEAELRAAARRKAGVEPAMSLPTETVSARGRGRGRAEEVLPVNAVSDGSEARNTKFRPTGR